MRRRAFVSLVAASGVAALGADLLYRPARARAGACAPATYRAVYLSPADVAIGRGGAVLVGVSTTFSGEGVRGDPFEAGGYALTRGDTRIPLRAERLAPGLLRLVPARFEPGTYAVHGPAVGELGVRLVAENAAPPTACTIASLSLTRRPGSQQPYSPPTWGVTARLRAALPAGVVGVVVAPAAAGAPYGLFAPATAREQSVALYSSPGRCAGSTPGAMPPNVGERIRLAVVGANGAVSVRSNDVVIEED